MLLPRKTISIIGAGYVGGPTGAVFANKCPDFTVNVVDIDEDRIKAWQASVDKPLPISEPSLDRLVREQLNRNLFFSTDIKAAVNAADMIFVCVNTPTKLFGIGQDEGTDVTYLESAFRLILACAIKPKIIVQKSTVSVNTAQSLYEIISASNGGQIDPDCFIGSHQVLSNPEFLAEGSAIHNLLEPDRVIIGGNQHTQDGQLAISALKEVYSRWIPEHKLITMSLNSAELCKLAANAMLAQRISSINAIGQVCEETGADVREVARAIGLDLRIGSQFLNAGLGFGGSCFSKDIKNLINVSKMNGLPLVGQYWQGVLDLNRDQVERFFRAMHSHMFNNMQGKKIVLLGMAFKENTGDTRESQSIPLAKLLLKERVHLCIFDPKVSQKEMEYALPSKDFQYKFLDRVDEQTCAKADALVVCNGTDDFSQLNFRSLYEVMQRPAYIFDGRINLNHDELRTIGFKVHSIGVCL